MVPFVFFEHSFTYISFTDDTLVWKIKSNHTTMPLVEFKNAVESGCNEIQQNWTGVSF